MGNVAEIEPEAAPPTVSDDAPDEIVDDRRVELPPRGVNAYRMAFSIASEIEQFSRPRNFGQAVTEAIFRLQS